jgi:hypothetical protein
MPKKKSTRRNTTNKKKQTRAKKSLRATKPARTRKPARKKRAIRGRREIVNPVVLERKGLGARAAGQSGDIAGLSHETLADSESQEELAEEGQAFEAVVVSGVEHAPDADEAEMTTHEIPEDDVPTEYDDR